MVVASPDVRLPRFLRREAGAEVDRLYRKHADEVLRYAMLVMRSRTDAEDITQTVFLRALRAIERGEKVRTPRNWLIKITHNECRRLLATRKVHIELPDEIAVEPVETGRAEELRVALDALPATQRQALVLRELEGRTYAEISQALDLSESAVETLIFRARRALREQIENAMSCEEFAELLEDPSARARVRAHARVCAPCATLERQARGRKSALKRIASIFGMPWWGAKLGAVALTTAAVTAVAVAVPTPAPHDSTRPSVPVANVAPTRTLNLVPAPRQLAVVPQSSAASTNHANVVPRSSRSKLVASRANSSSPASTATTPTAAGTPPATVTPAAVLPGPEEPAPSAPEPQTPQPEPLPSPTKVVPVTPPVHVPPVAVPAVAVPAVAVPTPPVAVTVPAVSVPQPVLPPVPDPPSVTVPTVSVPSQAPAPPTVTAPVETPKVKLP
jgi:RNA polymerase sigma factor (sigma-70 family)